MFWTYLLIYVLGFTLLAARICFKYRKNKSDRQELVYFIIFIALWPLLPPIILLYFLIDKIASAVSRAIHEKRTARARTKFVKQMRQILPSVVYDEAEALKISASLDDFVNQAITIQYDVKIIKEMIKQDHEIINFDNDYEFACKQLRDTRKQLYDAQEKLDKIGVGEGGSNQAFYMMPIGKRHRSYSETLPWAVVMTNHFKKSISSLDGKLRGKLLTAISEICDDPLTARGDTIKPLTHQFKDCWRYRIGDFRLIYLPETVSGRVVLLRFSPRGEAYTV